MRKALPTAAVLIALAIGSLFCVSSVQAQSILPCTPFPACLLPVPDPTPPPPPDPPIPQPAPPQPAPAPDPAPSTTTSTTTTSTTSTHTHHGHHRGHGGNRWKITAESVILMQGISIACGAVYEIGDGIVKARGPKGRELTPVGAIDNAANCGLMPAMVLKGTNWVTGVKDNECTLKIARDALKKHNDSRFQEEMLFRRAQGLSPMADQAEFDELYRTAYTQPCETKKKPVHKKKHHLRHSKPKLVS